MTFTEKMRPQKLEDFAGNQHIFCQNGIISTIFNQTIKNNSVLPSLILTGPAGIGKTSLAKIYTDSFKNYTFNVKKETSFNYVMKTFDSNTFAKKDFTEFIDSHATTHAFHISKKVIPVVFIDEFHTLNKTQQANLLSLVEQQKLLFIGATTESIFHRVQEGLRSRCHILDFKPLDNKEVLCLLIKTLNQLQPLNYQLPEDQQVDPVALAKLALSAQGDARKALSLLQTSIDLNNTITMTSVDVAISMTAQSFNYTDQMYNLLSALQKSIRASDSQASIFYLALLIKSGTDLLTICRRLVVIASEDIGLADNQALILATSTFTGVQQCGDQEGRILVAQCVVYLANAAKSNSAYKALDNCFKYIDDTIRNNAEMQPREDYRRSTAGPEYLYPHNFGGYVLDSAFQREMQSQIFWVDESVGKRL